MLVTSNIYYRNWRQYAFYIFLATALLTLAVFIPGLGMSLGELVVGWIWDSLQSSRQNSLRSVSLFM